MPTTYSLRDAAYAANVQLRDAREYIGRGAFRPTPPRGPRRWTRLTEADCVRLAIVGLLGRYGFDPAAATEILSQAGDNPLVIRASRAKGRTIVRGASAESHCVEIHVLPIEREVRERLAATPTPLRRAPPCAASLRSATPRNAIPAGDTGCHLEDS